jgi:probable phosphoglycerate mutase
VIRPGSTDYDRDGLIQGNLDVPLNKQGSDEVERLIHELRGRRIETVYTSCCQSAQQTARTIADTLGLKLRTLDNMQNLDHGLWQGMRVDDVRRKQPKVYRQWQERPQSVCPPQGEMLTHAEDRVRGAVNRLLKRHKNGAIALVVPEPLASLVRAYLNNGKIGDLWKASTEHGQWELLEVEPQGIAHGN